MTTNPVSVAVPNSVIDNKSLSFRALGLLTFLLSLTDEEAAHMDVRQLHQHGTEGRDSVRASIRELEAAGHMVRQQIRDPQGRLHWQHLVLEHPLPVTVPPPKRRASKQAQPRAARTGTLCGVCCTVQTTGPSPDAVTYFVQRGRFIKIGTTTALRSRLKMLARPNPGVLVPDGFDPASATILLGTTSQDEHALHQKFAQWHTTGEWFTPDVAMWALLGGLGLAF